MDPERVFIGDIGSAIELSDSGIKKLPDVVFVVDGVYEGQALKEANSLKLDTFAILNTN